VSERAASYSAPATDAETPITYQTGHLDYDQATVVLPAVEYQRIQAYIGKSVAESAELLNATRFLSAALVDVRDNLAEYADTKAERLGAARQAYRRAIEALEEYDDDL